MIDELVCAGLKRVHLPQPAKEEKREFVEAALDLYPDARFEDGLSIDGVVTLSVNTPNRSLENLLRASHRTGRIVTASEIAEQKNRDVEMLAEGTLTPLDTSRAEGLRLVGRNIEVAQAFLLSQGRRLLRGDPSMSANILLDGAPGTGKTDLALRVAYEGQCPAYQWLSPKGSLVGDTERRARLQQQALNEWVPNVSFCDEITESLPLQRGEFNGDSGASQAVTATLLSALSDEGRRGKTLLIATTNRPEFMGAAMRSRFTAIPILFPLKEDFPEIIVATAKRVTPDCEASVDDERVAEAADIFHSKRANPRHIRSALSNALLLSEKTTLDADAILAAAHDLCSTTDFASTIYADLLAIRYCTSRSLLPWSGNGSYPFPDYLKGIVDETTGDIDESALNRRLAELRPSVNV